MPRRPDSHYLDQVLDEESVRDRVAGSTDMVTVLNRAWLPGVAEAVEVLQGRRTHRELGAERVALLACGVCGDLNCGALTVRPDVTPSRCKGLQACLERVGSRLAQMPYDELAHTGKRFLWPMGTRVETAVAALARVAVSVLTIGTHCGWTGRASERGG